MGFRIATWNVWGAGEPWRYTAERGIVRGAVPGSTATTDRPAGGSWTRRGPMILQTMREADVHIAGLQEIVQDPIGANYQSDQLAAALHCNVAGPTVDGLALLSRYPITASTTVPVQCDPDGYGAGEFLHAVVSSPVGSIDVVTVHLTPRSQHARIQQTATIAGYVGRLPRRPVVVIGDFNTVDPSTPELDLLRDAGLDDSWSSVSRAAGVTMPSHDPVSRLDYILLGNGLIASDARLLGTQPDSDGYYASDHLGVLVEVQPAP